LLKEKKGIVVDFFVSFGEAEAHVRAANMPFLE